MYVHILEIVFPADCLYFYNTLIFIHKGVVHVVTPEYPYKKNTRVVVEVSGTLCTIFESFQHIAKFYNSNGLLLELRPPFTGPLV